MCNYFLYGVIKFYTRSCFTWTAMWDDGQLRDDTGSDLDECRADRQLSKICGVGIGCSGVWRARWVFLAWQGASGVDYSGIPMSSFADAGGLVCLVGS